MKPSTIITRLLFNKLNRSVARDENTRAREAKQAADQALHDEARANFLNWCEQVGDEHPLVAQTIAELTKVNESLTLTQATKAKRYNAIFTNAWSRAEAEYGATVASTPSASSGAKGLLHTFKPLVFAGGIFAILGLVGMFSNKSAATPATIARPIPAATPTQQISAAAQEVIDATAPTPEPEVRKAIAVTAAEKQARKDLARIDALADKRDAGKDFDYEAINAEIEAASTGELSYTISSTGKRHNSTCRYYGKGRPAKSNQGIPCKICGG